MKDDQGNGWFEMPIEFGFVFIGAGIAVGISFAVAVWFERSKQKQPDPSGPSSGGFIIARDPDPFLTPADRPDARRRTLISSLQLRYGEAQKRGDSKAKLVLFREAVYLGIQPQLFTDDH